MYLNKAIIAGNLTQDPELKSLPSGVQVTNFSVATNQVYTDRDGNRQEKAEFHNVAVFGRQAENSAQYLSKGRQVLVEGRLQTRSWEGPDGNKRYRTEIIADRVQFGPPSGGQGGGQQNQQSPGAGSGGDSQGSNQGAQNTGTQNTGGGQEAESGEQINYPDEEINPDDIPF